MTAISVSGIGRVILAAEDSATPAGELNQPVEHSLEPFDPTARSTGSPAGSPNR